MKNNKCTRRGFTLIELLVVVLVIGILSAVALPQYQKAVEKSKSAQALVLLKSVFQSAENYYLANGKWPTKFSELDVEIPWTGNVKYLSTDIIDTLSNEDWSIQIYRSPYHGVLVGRLTGDYKGAGFALFHHYAGTSGMKPYQLYCTELYDNPGSEVKFGKNAGAYCKNIFKAPTNPSYIGSYMRYYAIR